MNNRKGFRDQGTFRDSWDRHQNATMAMYREIVHSTDEIRTVTGGQTISCVVGELGDPMTTANHSSMSRAQRASCKRKTKS